MQVRARRLSTVPSEQGEMCPSLTGQTLPVPSWSLVQDVLCSPRQRGEVIFALRAGYVGGDLAHCSPGCPSSY